MTMMNLIIKQMRDHTTVFGGRIGGAAEAAQAEANGFQAVPACYVIPIEDDIRDSDENHEARVEIAERWLVLAVVSNTADARGQAAYAEIDAVRTDVLSALHNWSPNGDDGARGPLTYDGSRVQEINEARLVWQFYFETQYEIGPEDGFQPVRDDLTDVRIQVDAIDPADPNVQSSGPDGRIEAEVRITLPTE